jgi:hypothetical protein
MVRVGREHGTDKHMELNPSLRRVESIGTMKGLRIYGTLVLLTLTGCAGQSWKVASLENIYDYREANFEKKCVTVQVAAASAVECRALRSKLDTFRTDLQAASKSLTKGGSIKLQLSAAQADEKAVRP